MSDTILAYTKPGANYPGYVNISRDGDEYLVTVRSDPRTREGSFVCVPKKLGIGLAQCTVGDENCNNYCNMAPEKGPMADHPKAAVHTECGVTTCLKLSASEWADLKAALK